MFIVLINFQELKLKKKKKKQKKHNQKMGGRPKQTFLQGRHTGGPSSLDVEGPVPTVSFSGYASHLS